MATAKNPLWAYFHEGPLQNSVHHIAWCKGCVSHHEEEHAAALEEEIRHDDEATKLEKRKAAFDTACTSAGSIRGEKKCFITHILGSKRNDPCPYSSAEAIAEAEKQKMPSKNSSSNKPTTKLKRQLSELSNASSSTSTELDPTPRKKLKQAELKLYTPRDMPLSKFEVEAIQRQALRAAVSTTSKDSLFEDVEMLKLIGMLRKEAVNIMPTARVLGGRLLDKEAKRVKIKLGDILKSRVLGLSTDQWKDLKKNSIAAICVNVDRKSYSLELQDVTSLPKDGDAQCEQFEKMIEKTEKDYKCAVIYLVTDADGGSKKGRAVLAKKRPDLILPSCWAHQFQLILGDYFKVYELARMVSEEATFLLGWINNHGKVRKIFDGAQANISTDRNLGQIIILVYLVANLTRWTTHYVAFVRLYDLKDALQLAVLQSRAAIIAAQVGAAKYSEKQRLEDEAIKACNLIQDAHGTRDYSFWNALEMVIGDIEPICYGTNINQKDSTRADQVLLSIAGIYLHFSGHPEFELRTEMVNRIEKRWKDCDQPLFLAALILNPWEGLSRFGPRANLDHFKANNIIRWLYRRMSSRPDNTDTADERKLKEKKVSTAFFQFLASTSPFESKPEDRQEFREAMGDDPIFWWNTYLQSDEVKDLAQFAINIFTIIVNQAGCERTFSRAKFTQSPRRNRLGLLKIEKQTKVSSDIRYENQKAGLLKPRTSRKNHRESSVAKLLAVPRYSDLLEDLHDEDETERGRALVNSVESWRIEMAKWITEAREAEWQENIDEWNLDIDSDHLTSLPRLQAVLESMPRCTKPASMKLESLFGGLPHPARLPRTVINEEAALMEALADAEEDERLDDGAIEIDTDEEYIG
ncbi:hypothetical protein D9758_013487 [Tetrapyrgos nigripes]|uniref:DUF659 domain-containing protein n=1 Tax=Tetrapyrgos nigripes TaxID=182062 RepID=A0A8H5FRM9_9AGAR|nr:hypothetical protein D9758_013487 [Tetrapyrgos nigripes]